MKAFRRERDGTLSASFTGQERDLLGELATQIATLLSARGRADAADPALQRLLPDAYRDDVEAAAEFRKYTEDALAGRKIENAWSLVAALQDPARSDRVRLDPPAAQAWLRCLTDIRLTLAVRLGIEKDGDAGRTDETALGLHEIYDWLGFVQGSLVDALER